MGIIFSFRVSLSMTHRWLGYLCTRNTQTGIIKMRFMIQWRVSVYARCVKMSTKILLWTFIVFRFQTIGSSGKCACLIEDTSKKCFANQYHLKKTNRTTLAAGLNTETVCINSTKSCWDLVYYNTAIMSGTFPANVNMIIRDPLAFINTFCVRRTIGGTCLGTFAYTIRTKN